MNILQLLCSPSLDAPSTEQAWKDEYLEKLKTYIIPTEDHKWGQLILAWNEKRGESLISHIYAPWVDLETWEGVYTDDRPGAIYAKCFFQCLVRPFRLVVKTIYHISMIPIFYEIALAVKKQQSVDRCLKNSIRSLADIIRTPLFDIANIIGSLALLIISPFSPMLLYPGRRLLGRIELILTWGPGTKASAWTLAECFQPLRFSFFEHYKEKIHEDTFYPSDDLLDRQLTNFARSAVHYKQTHIDTVLCQKSAPDAPYVSELLI
jgi:hypothetical protein